MTATMSAVIAAIPEAEPVVSAYRRRLDRAAGWGVPAHVTMLFPFLPPDRLDDGVLAALSEAVGTVARFEFALARLAWFGDEVLWLAPEPPDAFRALTGAVWARFPDCPPYGGAHDDPVPHLTIGHDQPLDSLQAAAGAIAPVLPIRARVESVRLICGSEAPDSWATVAELPLGADDA